VRYFQDDPTIDGSFNKALARSILRHVATTSQLFKSEKSERKLDMFENAKPEQVFLHYQYLMDGGFIDGHCDIHSGCVKARWVTFEGHQLLASITPGSSMF